MIGSHSLSICVNLSIRVPLIIVYLHPNSALTKVP